MKKYFKIISLHFIFCIFSLELFGQTPPSTPSNPNPMNPIPTPVPPLPPTTNPSARPADTASIQIYPSPNQPQPASITPPAQSFPNAPQDTIFRSHDDPQSPFKTDSVQSPKK